MKIQRAVILEMDDAEEPREAMVVSDTYCRKCFAVIPGHRLHDHMRAVHGEVSAVDE